MIINIINIMKIEILLKKKNLYLEKKTFPHLNNVKIK